jgi:hypothetical protein
LGTVHFQTSAICAHKREELTVASHKTLQLSLMDTSQPVTIFDGATYTASIADLLRSSIRASALIGMLPPAKSVLRATSDMFRPGTCIPSELPCTRSGTIGHDSTSSLVSASSIFSARVCNLCCSMPRLPLNCVHPETLPPSRCARQSGRLQNVLPMAVPQRSCIHTTRGAVCFYAQVLRSRPGWDDQQSSLEHYKKLGTILESRPVLHPSTTALFAFPHVFRFLRVSHPHSLPQKSIVSA